MEQLAAIVFVLLALWGAVWYLRRKGVAVRSAPLGARRQAHPIEQVDRMKLTPQHSIHLLRIDGRKLLVGVHPQGFTLLAEPSNDSALAKGAAGI